MQASDIDGVVAVARVAFPDHFEARACFEERLALFWQGCFVLGCGGSVKGYLIAYPWPLGSIPPLDSLLGGLPADRDAFYLHDLALHPQVRGQGHARPIVERVIKALRDAGGSRVALVSVNDTLSFWRGMGFVPVDGDAGVARKLASYGDGARYMVREV
jgi:GNAT superfamily N-acetyltransferase